MATVGIRLIPAVLLALLALGGAGCAMGSTAEHRRMTDAWRSAVADTIRTLIAESQQAYESNDCDAAGDVAWLPDRAPLVHFSAEDRVFRLENREEIIAYCNRIAQGRLSTHEELEEQTVHLLTPDAAYVVTRSVATTRSRDGRTEVTPTVETAIAARQRGRWRLVYKHLSWREAEVADERTGLRISNVRLFDAVTGTFSEPTGILIRDGRIRAVGPLPEPGEAEEEIDARGGFALPGLWESHTHLSDLTLGGPDSVRTTLEAFVQSGVLYLRDVGGPLDIMSAMRQRVQAGELMGPEIFFSGPLAERPPLLWGAYNEQLPGLTVPITTQADVDSLVTAVARAGGSYVKTFGKWDVELFRRLVRLAGESDLEVVVDPGAPFFQDIPIDTALAAGVTSIEHAIAAWQSVLPAALKATHDSVASLRDQAALIAFLTRVIPLGTAALDLDLLRSLGDRMVAAGVYFTPTLNVLEAWRVSPPSLPWFSPENPARHWNAFADAATRITQILAERGVKFLIGQDGADPNGTVREMELLVAVGIPAADVLRAATLHPAQWLKLDHEIGSLQVGRRADLVVVGDDPIRDMTALRSPLLVLQGGTVRRRSGL